jgi:hypothetical protein
MKFRDKFEGTTLLLALKIERDNEPKNAGGFWKLE